VQKPGEIMNELGFENAYNLVGGIIEWDGEVVVYKSRKEAMPLCFYLKTN
jgi:predicted sulfurtransferase